MMQRLTLTLWSSVILLPSMVIGQGYAPDVAAEKMTTAEGLKVSLFAAEPAIRQPILVKCDDRGRVWTIQYLQYPNPAGLKRVKVDRWSRTVYDRVPEPPPRGPKGADKITICEDTNSDGRADKFTDFVTGLNLCTGLAFGHGGVFVLQVPYLLFYADENHDDVPDGDPKVCLEGFGMEDAQALANHLTWGPDGWLYGVNGSTTTCRIRGIEFQQGCWRYHPQKDEFELFCEGGQNTFGLTFDAEGELYYATNGGPFVHAAQGALFYKTFGKHGPLHHPYAYHHFPPLVVDNVPGGPPTGGTIYAAKGLTPAQHGTFIAGNFLGHTVSWWSIKPKGETVEAKYGGVLLDAHDTWFGATDLAIGANGELYVSDFHDARTAHPDPDANWDRSNGRIYSIRSADNQDTSRWTNLAQTTSGVLLELLLSDNGVRAEQARMELARRRDASIIPKLKELARDGTNTRNALEGLWTLHGMEAVDDPFMVELLRHSAPAVRRWTIRLAGDSKRLSQQFEQELLDIASTEVDPTVRVQLAASIRRWPAESAIALIMAFLDHQSDKEQERAEWMIWWGIESKAISHRKELVAAFMRDRWSKPSFDRQRLRLIRRYASEGTTAGYESAANLLEEIPESTLPLAYSALANGLRERGKAADAITQGDLFKQQANVMTEGEQKSSAVIDRMTGELSHWIAAHLKMNADNVALIECALRAEVPQSDRALMVQLQRYQDPTAEWLRLVPLLNEDDRKAYLLERLARADEKTQIEVVRLLAHEKSADVGDRLLGMLEVASAKPALKVEIRRALFSRLEWAGMLLRAVDRGEVLPASIPVDELRFVAAQENTELDGLVRKHWGNVGAGTAEEKLAVMRRLSNDLRAGSGDIVSGQALFMKHCGTCHKMMGEGAGIAPDLTTANRHDRAALLASIVDPSAVIRREFLRYVVEMDNGQVVAGLLADQDPASVTIVDERNQRTRIAREEIALMTESSTSLMPERILESLSPQQLRDLFAFLEQP